MPANRVTVNGDVIAFKPGNSMVGFGTFLPVKAKPTAPDECTFPLRNNVTGLPVMNGVEDAMRPSFWRGRWISITIPIPHISFMKMNGVTDFCRMGKRC